MTPEQIEAILADFRGWLREALPAADAPTLPRAPVGPLSHFVPGLRLDFMAKCYLIEHRLQTTLRRASSR